MEKMFYLKILHHPVFNTVHEWKFKHYRDLDELVTGDNADMIGIFDMDDEHEMKYRESLYFDDWGRGYGFVSSGQLTRYPSIWGRKYGNKWRTNDEIEMKLDFNEQHLKFKINGKDFGVAFEFDATKRWKAAIAVGARRRGKSKFTLISYQGIY